jgi:hypothetical protein
MNDTLINWQQTMKCVRTENITVLCQIALRANGESETVQILVRRLLLAETEINRANAELKKHLERAKEQRKAMIYVRSAIRKMLKHF